MFDRKDKAEMVGLAVVGVVVQVGALFGLVYGVLWLLEKFSVI